MGQYSSKGQTAVTVALGILLVAYLGIAFLTKDWLWPSHLGSSDKEVVIQPSLEPDTVKKRQVIAWQKYADTLKNRIADLKQDSAQAWNRVDSLQKALDTLKMSPPAVIMKPARTHQKGHGYKTDKSKNTNPNPPLCGCPID